MADWQIFKVVGGTNGCSISNGGDRKEWYTAYLDKYVEYNNEYYKHINMSWGAGSPFGFQPCGARGYVKIDLDKTRNMSSSNIFDNSVWKEVPWEVAQREGMIIASSVNSEALAVTQDGINRINRGEISEFEYKMEDNSGNRHQWIYRK